MDATSTIQAPSGQMTRARARAIQSEVNSLLVKFPFDPFETWLLPQTETLCVLRYHESSQGEGVVQDGHQYQGGIPPSLGGPVQPVNNRPGGTTGRLPLNCQPPFCDRAVQGRYCTGSTGRGRRYYRWGQVLAFADGRRGAQRLYRSLGR